MVLTSLTDAAPQHSKITRMRWTAMLRCASAPSYWAAGDTTL